MALEEDTPYIKDPANIFSHILEQVKPGGKFIKDAHALVKRAAEIMEAFEKSPTSPAPSALTVKAMRMIADSIEKGLKVEAGEVEKPALDEGSSALLDYVRQKGLK